MKRIFLRWLVRATPGVWNEVVNEGWDPVWQSGLRRINKFTKLRVEIEGQFNCRQVSVQTTNRRHMISEVTLEQSD